MLSGIGPAAQLAFHNVSPLVDLPGVGEHLMDHPIVNLGLLDKSGHSIGWFRERMNFKIASAILQWTWMGTGPMTTNVSECIARQNTGV
jgi:choline dehydrogenase